MSLSGHITLPPFSACQFSHPRRQEKTISVCVLVSLVDWLPTLSTATSASCNVKHKHTLSLSLSRRPPYQLIPHQRCSEIDPIFCKFVHLEDRNIAIVSQPIRFVRDAKTVLLYTRRNIPLYRRRLPCKFATSISLALELMEKWIEITHRLQNT